MNEEYKELLEQAGTLLERMEDDLNGQETTDHARLSQNDLVLIRQLVHTVRLHGRVVVTEYPLNLLHEIGIACSELEVTKDMKAALESALGTLSPRQQQVISLRYREGLSLKEVAKELSVTSERVRQLEMKALRTLSDPENRNRICYGENFSEKLQTEQRKLRAQMAEYTAKRLLCAEKTKKLEEQIERVTNALNDLSDPEEDLVLETPIENLGLSVRSVNVLLRAGKKTLYDLTQMTKTELSLVRNMGKHSYEEVLLVMEKLGVSCKKERTNE